MRKLLLLGALLATFIISSQAQYYEKLETEKMVIFPNTLGDVEPAGTQKIGLDKKLYISDGTQWVLHTPTPISVSGQDYVSVDASGRELTFNPINLPTHVTGVLPLTNGGTGSSTQNFVDLSNNQNNIAGEKTFTNLVTIETSSSSALNFKNTRDFNTNLLFKYNNSDFPTNEFTAVELSTAVFSRVDGSESSLFDIEVKSNGSDITYRCNPDGRFQSRRFWSTVATGTAPLQITSTTLNTNLNADLLDGMHASEFALSSEVHDPVTLNPDTRYLTLTDQQINVALINLASHVTGTLADGSLSSNVALKNIDNNFSANQTINKPTPTFQLKSTDMSILSGETIGSYEFYSSDADGAHISGYIKSIGQENFGRQSKMTFGITVTNSTDAVDRFEINSLGVNSFGNYQIGGADINTAGTLSNVAYLNQANLFEGQEIPIQINGVNLNSYIRFTEGTSQFQGAYINYDGVENIFKIGTHNANDSDKANDIDIIRVLRGSSTLRIVGLSNADSGYQVAGTTVIDASRNFTGGSGTFTGRLDIGATANTGQSRDVLEFTNPLLATQKLAKITCGNINSANQFIGFEVNEGSTFNNLVERLRVTTGGINVNGVGTFSGKISVGSGTPSATSGAIEVNNSALGFGSQFLRLITTQGGGCALGPTDDTANPDWLWQSNSGENIIFNNVLTIPNSGGIDVNGTVTADNVFQKATQTLSGTTPTYNCSTSVNAKITLTGNTTATLTNLVDGMSGNFFVTQDATGNRTLTILPTPKVINGGGGSVTLTGTANSTDIISWTYDGSTLYVTYGLNYN